MCARQRIVLLSNRNRGKIRMWDIPYVHYLTVKWAPKTGPKAKVEMKQFARPVAGQFDG